MMPGVNPRQMQSMMKRMGITQQDIDAEVVVIKLSDGKEIIIKNPSVQKVNMMGQKSYQITGEEEVVAASVIPDINEDDIRSVMDATGASKEKAKDAIIRHEGDLAAAIMELQ